MPGRPSMNYMKHPLSIHVSAFEGQIRGGNLTLSSAHQLLYLVRRGLSYLPSEITVDALRDFIDSLPQANRASARSAWRRFAECMDAILPGAVPTLPSGTSGRPVTRVSRRDVLLLALRDADPYATTLDALSEIRWHDVRCGIEFGVISLPRVKVQASMRYLERVAREAIPESTPPLDGGYPLFPSSPGSREPLSTWRVEQAINRARTAICENKVEPWKPPPNIHKLKL